MEYFTHRDTAGHHDLYGNDSEAHRKGYPTDLISGRAVEFIGRKRKDPFLLSVHYNAPHWPEGIGRILCRETSRGYKNVQGSLHPRGLDLLVALEELPVLAAAGRALALNDRGSGLQQPL